MTDVNTNVDGSPPVVFAANTITFDAETDACYDWLRKRYKDGKLHTSISALKDQVQNDVAACGALRWKRFAFPSDPYLALPPNFNNENTKNDVVKVVLETHEKVTHSANAQVTAHLVNPSDVKTFTKGGAPVAPPEPSRHIWEPLLASSTALTSQPSRPAFGGYMQPSQPDSLRFLLFPQRHHSNLTTTAADSLAELRVRRLHTLQAVPFYLRGTAHLDRDVLTPLSRKATADNYIVRLLAATQLNVFAGYQLPRHETRQGVLALPLFDSVDGVDVELFGHQSHVERRYSPVKNKVERCTLVRHGVATTLTRPDPRHGLRWEATLSTVRGSGRQKNKHATASDAPVHDDSIIAVSIMDTYNSTTQRWNPTFWRRRGGGVKRPEKGLTYGVQWRAGPGLEVVPSDGCATLFGKFSSESWLDVPLPSRFSLKLRQQATFVQPFTPRHFEDDHVGEDGGDSSSPTFSVSESRLRPHRYFWATQGPKWNPKLVRGFDNDYSSLHHAERWYAILSAEISRKRQKSKAVQLGQNGPGPVDSPGSSGEEGRGGGFFSRIGATAFVNACFADTIKAAPRASVGFSLQSEFPRFTIDAFNKLVPSTFECSFSWFVAMKEKRLMTGLQPGAPDDQQFMRVSPVETFRHMKCGLTWNF